MNDIFREVDEEYRHEQILQFWHHNAKLIILALVVSIAGAGGAGLWQSRQMAKRQQETYILSHAVGDGSMQAPAVGLATVIQSLTQMTGQRVIPARFAVAHAMLTAGNKAGAIKSYDAIAASAIATKTEKNLADLYSIGLQIQDGDPAQLNARLDRLSDDRNPWRFSARELKVLLAMRQGNMQLAHDTAVALAKDTAAPDGVHGRAGQLAALTGEGLAPTPADGPADEAPEAP
jgi:hypothetical protein